MLRPTAAATSADSQPPISRRIRAYFNDAAADEEHYPSTIDPRILHVKLVLDHLGDLTGKRVADVGCGKGRFARIVKERNPEASVIALDLAEAMLGTFPRHRARRRQHDRAALRIRIRRRRLRD